MPALLRACRKVYADAIGAELAREGHDDVPRNGVFVIGAIARDCLPLGEVIAQLGMSKQAAGQLVDALVVRGYLLREVDANDRRRLIVRLSERGRAVAVLARGAVARIDAQLAQRVSREWIEHTRATLAALTGDDHGG
jgi:DNA-binding MarR family transcriptional regulator